MPRGWLNIEAPGDTIFGGQKAAFEDICGIKLGYKMRLYGFAGCFVLGLIFSILGTIQLFIGFYVIFAILFTIGIIINIIGTGFLIGPMKQVTSMFKPVRVVATIVLVITIGFTFISAFVIKSAVICLIMVIIEYIAYLWYCLSYIPYARDVAWNMLPKALRWE